MKEDSTGFPAKFAAHGISRGVGIMKYWEVQTIAREYVCPVQMVTRILGQLTARDIFDARREDVSELQEACEIIAEVCDARKKVQLQNLRKHFIS